MALAGRSCDRGRVVDLRLVPPTSRLHASWLSAREEWGLGVHQDGASVWTADRLALDLADPDGFRAWVEALLVAGDPTQELPDDLVPATNLWVVEDDRYLGAVQLRHQLNPFLAALGGHIGYGVRPGARRRGVASFALAQVLPRARRLGLSRVLLTCADHNQGSARTIERNGGVLEAVRQPDDYAFERDYDHPLRRYWITL